MQLYPSLPALTVWQPWATLIMIGAKPHEYRRWDYRARYPRVVGARIAIHAGARPVHRDEVAELLQQIRAGDSDLRANLAVPLLERILDAHQCRGVVPLAAVVGTVVVKTPRRVTDLFRGRIDSDRLDHGVWAWPVTDPAPLLPPVPARGAQGFWRWAAAEAA